LGDALDQPGQPCVGDGFDDAQRDGSLNGRQVGHRRQRFGAQRDQPFGVFQKVTAFARERGPTAAAVEKPGAELPPKGGDAR